MRGSLEWTNVANRTGGERRGPDFAGVCFHQRAASFLSDTSGGNHHDEITGERAESTVWPAAWTDGL